VEFYLEVSFEGVWLVIHQCHRFAFRPQMANQGVGNRIGWLFLFRAALDQGCPFLSSIVV